MRKFHDQLGRTIEVKDTIAKIVCLVPSITELLYDLGLGDKVVGRTKFCIFNDHDVSEAEKIGGTKQVHFDKIIELNPDIILANKEENTEEIVNTLDEHFPVYVSSIQTVHGALAMIGDLGQILNVEKQSLELIQNINDLQIAFHKTAFEEKKCIYLIWQNPIMSVGIDTFIYNMLQEMNFTSVVRDFRYPELSIEEIKNSSAEYILLSSEPFPFGKSHKKQYEKLFPNKKTILVDGSYFSWYGSRLLKAYDYMKMLRQTI
jgi:ABC-type Fe3+-hydroxamate transport system substrate-binding protein